jgi:hypothetical protein
LEDDEKAEARIYRQATGETINELSRLQRTISSQSGEPRTVGEASG